MLKKRIKFYLQLFFGLVASLVFLISSVTVFADSGVPRIISYQGRLMNSSGDLLGGSGTTSSFLSGIVPQLVQELNSGLLEHPPQPQRQYDKVYLM
jgi:hypothetical protein